MTRPTSRWGSSSDLYDPPHFDVEVIGSIRAIKASRSATRVDVMTRLV